MWRTEFRTLRSPSSAKRSSARGRRAGQRRRVLSPRGRSRGQPDPSHRSRRTTSLPDTPEGTADSVAVLAGCYSRLAKPGRHATSGRGWPCDVDGSWGRRVHTRLVRLGPSRVCTRRAPCVRRPFPSRQCGRIRARLDRAGHSRRSGQPPRLVRYRRGPVPVGDRALHVSAAGVGLRARGCTLGGNPCSWSVRGESRRRPASAHTADIAALARVSATAGQR